MKYKKNHTQQKIIRILIFLGTFVVTIKYFKFQLYSDDHFELVGTSDLTWTESQNSKSNLRDTKVDKKPTSIRLNHRNRPIRKKNGKPNWKVNEETLFILIWSTSDWETERKDRWYNYKVQSMCGNCLVTTDRNLVNKSAAVVIFQNFKLLKQFDLPDPKERDPNQVYIFWSRETPAKTYLSNNLIKKPGIDEIFNWTWYFRHDSDIVHHTGKVQNAIYLSKLNNITNNLEKLLKQKTGLSVWAVSNCYKTYGATKRMEYGKQLMEEGLNVTAFGECFNNFDKSDRYNRFSQYKFYLAFENSINCPNYVTEKFWRNSLEVGAVPIVFGPSKEDVKEVAPPYSFIHTNDFKSPKQLVEYIKYLDKNDTAYLEYHRWRELPLLYEVGSKEMLNNIEEGLCNICLKVTQKPLIHKSIPSISDWMYGKSHYKDDQCLYIASKNDMNSMATKYFKNNP